MVDVYIAFVATDEPRVRRMSESLKSEGWSVWDRPIDPIRGPDPEAERYLGSAGVVLAVWSLDARGSERMRSEAGSGLYKNKLVQARVDGAAPPLPFDQVELCELADWDGDETDPQWEKVVARVRTCAGSPGAVRPQVIRVAQTAAAAVEPARAPRAVSSAPKPAPAPPPAAHPAAPPASAAPAPRRPAGGRVNWSGGRGEPPPPRAPQEEVNGAYNGAYERTAIRRAAEVRAAGYEPTAGYAPEEDAPEAAPGDRRLRVGALAAAALVVMGGAAVWMLGPFGGDDVTTRATEAAVVDPAAADAAWAGVDRTNPVAVRAFISAHDGAPAAEAARSVLRVLDAQAWSEAVIADTEAAYSAYLASFPQSATLPGGMAVDASERLVSLGEERRQAILAIQSGLRAMESYRGAMDGSPNAATVQAARDLAARLRAPAPDLVLGAPRDLRAFGDVVMGALPPDARARLEAEAVSATAPAPAPAPAAAGAAPAPIVAAAGPTPAQAAAAAAAAAEAERVRIEAAQRAVAEAEAQSRLQEQQRLEREAARVAAAAAQPAPTPVAATPAAAPETPAPDAESLALAELQRAERSAWTTAQSQGTLAGYQTYLRNFPNGANAAAARTQVERLTRPTPFAVTDLPPALRTAVEAARAAQATAQARAAAARNTASEADRVAAAPGTQGVQVVTAPDGDRYVAQVAGSEITGLGVRVSGDATSRGDRYRGQLRGGLGQGLGVYEFDDNPNNSAAGALRYEGEHAGDAASGLGVTYWRNGNTYAGEDASGGAGRGVMTFADGQRYDGELRNGQRHGYGVVWSAGGEVVMAGRWENGQLVEPVQRNTP